MSKTIPLAPKDYQQKRYEAAKDLLAAALPRLEQFNAIGDDRQLESIVANCVFLADHLLGELGYYKHDPSKSSVHNIKDILNNEEE